MRPYIKYLYITIFLITALCSIIVMHPGIAKADSMDNSVSSADELYAAMSNQILNHISSQSYYLASDELVSMVSGKNTWNGFHYHYNASSPLMSGCYADRQIMDGNISWFTTNQRTINISFKFKVPKDTMSDYFRETQELAVQLKGENDYESVKNVHDYLINRVEYDHSDMGENYTDIEGFRENRMVCQGYAMATFVLLSYMNIPVRIVNGQAGPDENRGNHAWNVVQIDGKWYNYDSTWDDAGTYGTTYTYFLKSNQDFPMHYPEGIYADHTFTEMISTESYPTGLDTDMNNIYIGAIVTGVVIGLLISIIRSHISKGKSSVKESNLLQANNLTHVGTVIEDDFDSF